MRTVSLITTGGTIEKTYDELTGELANRRSIVEHRLQRLKSHITVLKRGEIILVLKGTLIKARRTAQTPAHRETIPVSQYSLQGGELELSDWLVPMEVIRSYG